MPVQSNRSPHRYIPLAPNAQAALTPTAPPSATPGALSLPVSSPAAPGDGWDPSAHTLHRPSALQVLRLAFRKNARRKYPPESPNQPLTSAESAPFGSPDDSDQNSS